MMVKTGLEPEEAPGLAERFVGHWDVHDRHPEHGGRMHRARAKRGGCKPAEPQEAGPSSRRRLQRNHQSSGREIRNGAQEVSRVVKCRSLTSPGLRWPWQPGLQTGRKKKPVEAARRIR